MADDGEVKIKTTIDNSGLDKGLKDAQKKVKDAGKAIDGGAKSAQKFGSALKDAAAQSNSFTSGLLSAAKSGGAYAAAIAVAIEAAKKYIQAIRDTSEAYKEMLRAETTLNTAAANNPYLNEASVDRLKDFAGELQKVSNIAAGTTIKIESQLAATGRTEEEIIKIMKAASEYAAATGTDIESAAQTLNSTFSGMAGALGRQIGEIKDLTEEELKHGKAVDIIAQKYKGMAKATQDARAQAKNAKDDLAEALGKITKPTADAWDNFWKGFYNGMSKAVDWFSEKLAAANYAWYKDGYIESVSKMYENKNTGEWGYAAEFQTTEYLKSLEKVLKTKNKLEDKEKQALFIIDQEIKRRERLAEFEKQEAIAAEEKRKAREEAAKNAGKSADDYARENTKALNDKLKAMEIEAEITGKEIDAQDVYNVYLQSYIDLLTKTEDKIKEGFPIEEKRRAQLEEAKKAAQEAAEAEEKLARAIEYTNQVTALIEEAQKATTPAGQLKEQLAEMQKAKEAIKAMSDEEIKNAQKDAGTDYSKEELLQGIAEAEKEITKNKVDELVRIEESGFDKIKEENEKLLEMKRAINDSKVLSAEEKAEKIREIENSIARNNIDTFAGIMEQVDSYAKQVTNTMQQAADIMLQTVKYQTDAELATLEKKYLQGEINEEEYQEERIKAKKKAAKEEYKINLFQWSASILTATADIAAGAAKSLSLGFPMGIIAMALTMAAGAVQIASLIAAKPTPPSFAGGGIVQGSSYRGDNVRANVNSGEMILNATQQKALWEVANGRETRGGGINLNITNKAANMVSATPKIDRNQMDIVIDMRVNDSLKNGRYDQSLEAAEAGMGGVFYGI